MIPLVVPVAWATPTVIPTAWLALEALRKSGETLSIPELVLYLRCATGLEWPAKATIRLIREAYRAHLLPGRAPIRYRPGEWPGVAPLPRERRRRT